MWSSPLAELPERIDVTGKSQVNTKKFFENLLKTHSCKYGVIHWTSDYSSIHTAYTALHASIKRHGFPIILHVRGTALYYERRDI